MADRPKAKNPSQRGQHNDSRKNGKAPKKHPKAPSRNAHVNKTPEQLAKIAEREAARKARLTERRASEEAARKAAEEAAVQAELRRRTAQSDRDKRRKRQKEAAERLQGAKDATLKMHFAKAGKS